MYSTYVILLKEINSFFLRACLHEGGGLQVGEVTCGGSRHLSCKRDQIKMRDYMDRRVIPLKREPHLPGVPHLHVNRSLVNHGPLSFQTAYPFILLSFSQFLSHPFLLFFLLSWLIYLVPMTFFCFR